MGSYWREKQIISQTVDLLVYEPEGEMMHYRIGNARLNYNWIKDKGRCYWNTWEEVMEVIKKFLETTNRKDEWDILRRKLIDVNKY